MLIYSIAVLLLGLQNSSGFTIRKSVVTECGDKGLMVYAVRKQFLQEHNERRASLADGDGTWPPAANMRFMAYDCDLEEEAIKLNAAGCDRFPDEVQFNGDRTNVASFEWKGNGPISVAKKAVLNWWNKKPKEDKIPRITNDSAMPFFLIAQAETGKFGCSVRECGYSHYNVACIYEKKAEVGHNLYEDGTACENCNGNCYQKLCNATTSVEQ